MSLVLKSRRCQLMGDVNELDDTLIELSKFLEIEFISARCASTPVTRQWKGNRASPIS